jgi:hypothetical protein
LVANRLIRAQVLAFVLFVRLLKLCWRVCLKGNGYVCFGFAVAAGHCLPG